MPNFMQYHQDIIYLRNHNKNKSNKMSLRKQRMSEIDNEILKKFVMKRRLGKGAYGIVWKAIDKKSNQPVAVKKIFDAFRNETDSQRTYREITFLRRLNNHPNIVQLFEVHRASNDMDMYLIFEFMESDLHDVIKCGNILKDLHRRYIMYQILNAVKYIHSGNIIHRDLKPSNILINSRCVCKIADFGLARSISHRINNNSSITNLDSTEPILTDYVATRWYRAPEILVASRKYTKGIDMWSVGCILGEMLHGKPLFPGSSTVNQIEKIISALPEPTERDIAAVGAGFGSALLNQKAISNHPKLDELIDNAPKDAKDLVKCLLLFNPNLRLTAKQALNHKYIERFRHRLDEKELHCDIIPLFHDDVLLSVGDYRSKLYEIVHSENGSSVERKSSSLSSKHFTTINSNSNSLKKSSTSSSINSALPSNNNNNKFDNIKNEKQLPNKQISKINNIKNLPHHPPTKNSSSLTINKSNTNFQNGPSNNSDTSKQQNPKIKYCKIADIGTNSITDSSRDFGKYSHLYRNVKNISSSSEQKPVPKVSKQLHQQQLLKKRYSSIDYSSSSGSTSTNIIESVNKQSEQQLLNKRRNSIHNNGDFSSQFNGEKIIEKSMSNTSAALSNLKRTTIPKKITSSPLNHINKNDISLSSLKEVINGKYGGGGDGIDIKNQKTHKLITKNQQITNNDGCRGDCILPIPNDIAGRYYEIKIQNLEDQVQKQQNHIETFAKSIITNQKHREQQIINNQKFENGNHESRLFRSDYFTSNKPTNYISDNTTKTRLMNLSRTKSENYPITKPVMSFQSKYGRNYSKMAEANTRRPNHYHNISEQKRTNSSSFEITAKELFNLNKPSVLGK